MYSEYIVGTTKLAPHPCHWVPGVVAWSWVVFFYFAHMVPQYFCGGIPRERIKGEVWYLYDIGNWSTCRMVQGSVATLNYLRLGAARGGVCTPHNCTTRSTWKSEPSALSSLSAFVRIRMKIRINWPLNLSQRVTVTPPAMTVLLFWSYDASGLVISIYRNAN
jgi:hypothetical protein